MTNKPCTVLKNHQENIEIKLFNQTHELFMTEYKTWFMCITSVLTVQRNLFACEYLFIHVTSGMHESFVSMSVDAAMNAMN